MALSSTERAFIIPEIVEAVIAHALSLQACEATDLRLVNKLFNWQADGIIWEEIWMCDYGSAYGPAGRTHFDLKAMLERRPNLCLYLKHANFEMSGPHMLFRLELIPKARNMTWLSVTDLELLAAHWAQTRFTLPKLRGFRVDIAPVTGHDGPARLQMKEFLESLTSVKSLSVFTIPREGEFFPWESYRLVELLDGIASGGPGIAPNIKNFGLLLSSITTCSQEEIASLLQTFVRLKGVRMDIPPEAVVLHLVDLFPDSLEGLSIRCGLESLCSVLEDLGDAQKLPKLREVPILQLHGFGEVPGFGVKSELVDRAIKGLSGRSDIQITCRDRDRLSTLVTDESLESAETSTSSDPSSV